MLIRLKTYIITISYINYIICVVYIYIYNCTLITKFTSGLVIQSSRDPNMIMKLSKAFSIHDMQQMVYYNK